MQRAWRRIGEFAAGGRLFWLSALVLIASLVLGGGTRSGFWSDALLQLIAVSVLLAAISHSEHGQSLKGPIALVLLALSVPLLQLIPLPPSIWTALPGHDRMVAALATGEQPLSWKPLSVWPDATWLSALSLLVPASVFLATSQLTARNRRRLAVVVLATGLLSVFVGLLQVAQGPASPLRFYAITNPTEAVGFFANRNHFAALLYSLTLLAAAFAINMPASAGAGSHRPILDAATILPLIGGFTVLVVLVAAQTMARSRAGLGLTIVALVGAAALAVGTVRHGSRITPSKLLVGATGLALLFAMQFALFRVMERFATDPLADSRFPLARQTIEAAKTFLPTGSGMGTFVPVYAAFEAPDHQVHAFANRAHNDILELFLEAGVLGLAVAIAFAAWFLRRAVKIWRQPARPGSEIDVALARAGTLIVTLLIAHAVVDYPLRTGALMAVFAFACGLLVDPPAGSEQEALPEDRRNVQRRRVPHRPTAMVPNSQATHTSAAAPSDSSSSGQPEEWSDTEWPEAWRQPSGGARPRAEDDH